jgi:hypothetical protein
MSAAAIVGLFLHGRPTAIARFVIPVVVDAVDREAMRALTHVSQEIIEDQPSFADSDAAPSIVFPNMAFWIEASGFHGRPRTVGVSNAFLVCGGVPVSGLSFPFSLKAPAARGVATRQIVADGDDFDTAITETQEAFVFSLGVRKLQDGQATEALIWERGSHD